MPDYDFKAELERLGESKISSQEVFNGNLLHVFHDEVTLPNGKPAGRDLIRHGGAVAIVPVTDDGCVYVERQFRYPLNRVITEIPAGKLDSKNEDRLLAAQRELREETGLVADIWTPIGTFVPSPAYTDEVIWLYVAQGLRKGERELDDDEFIDVQKVPMKELVQQIMDGQIDDGKSVAALLKAAVLLKMI